MKYAPSDRLRTNLQRALIFCCAFLFLVFQVPAHVKAASAKEERAINLQLPWVSYDTALGCAPNAEGDVPTGGDNTETAYLYFTMVGLSPAQASGIIGNLLQESNLNPEASNQGNYKGIAQWDAVDRYPKLEAFAEKEGGEADSLAVQLQFIWHELQTGYQGALNNLKAATTPEAAALVFQNEYEVAIGQENEKRQAYAKQVFAEFGNTPGGVAGNGSGCAPSDFVNGFTVYSQCDPAWGSKLYGTDTICAAGCGPSAMAMIITAFTGKRVTPEETVPIAYQEGAWAGPGVGSWGTVSPKLAEHYGLKAKQLDMGDGDIVGQINKALSEGALISTSGKGARPFFSGGHYIVIRAVTESGKWLIGDSGSRDTSDDEWDPQALLPAMQVNNNVWAITK